MFNELFNVISYYPLISLLKILFIEVNNNPYFKILCYVLSPKLSNVIPQLLWGVAIIYPDFPMEKLKFRKFQSFIQEHISSKMQKWFGKDQCFYFISAAFPIF